MVVVMVRVSLQETHVSLHNVTYSEESWTVHVFACTEEEGCVVFGGALKLPHEDQL